MAAYYNENNRFCAQWLRNLISKGYIADGEVDERSISDVSPDDLKGFTQCHFFAGIGGWSYALRLAGWGDDVPVWTGSCPCQPFSVAGKQKGFDDERHLFPVWNELIKARAPEVVFGEQIAGKAGLEWFDAVSSQMEHTGYSVWAANLCAAGIGAPHIRQRLFFACWLGDTDSYRFDTSSEHDVYDEKHNSQSCCGIGGMEHSVSNGLERGLCWRSGSEREVEHGQVGCYSSIGDVWSKPDWVECRDGKLRPIEPSIFPLAYGVSKRMVCACTQCHMETMIYEGMYFLRKIPEMETKPEQKEILRQRVLSFASSVNEYIGQECHAQQSAEVQERQMRTVRQHIEATRSSHRQESDEQYRGQFTNSMFCLPSQYTCQEHALNVCRVWKVVQSREPQEWQQDLFCPVCERVGAHLCRTEMVKNSAGRLCSYGNAIVPQLAATFIIAFMES